jgi:pimeloyl-ACP methyl ester carboxylesterase
MAGAAVVGAAAGVVLASRWALLVAPVAHVMVLELVRLPVHGPTVDGIRFGSLPEIAAFLLGRGWYGLVALLPMVVAAAYGAVLARRLHAGPARPRGFWHATAVYTRRGIAGLAVVGLVGLAMLIARPASTAPILGPDGQPLPGSIAELTTVPLGGHDQALLLRGHDVDNPVLLYLVGGPGGSQLGHVRATMEGLEEDFVLVTWEQRGAGKSYTALDPTDTHTLDQAVADTLELTDYLRERFGQERIYLLGNSWGTIPSVLAVQQRPELFHAYIGSAQMVDIAETDRRFHAELLAVAERAGDTGLAAELDAYGQPPYADVVAGQNVAIHYASLLLPESDLQLPGPDGVGASEYNLVEKRNVFAGLIDTYAIMYPQLQELDFRRDAPSLDVPVYVVQGAQEAPGRDDLAREWFDQLIAPHKALFTLESADHNPNYQAPDQFRQVMTQVLDDTYSE